MTNANRNTVQLPIGYLVNSKTRFDLPSHYSGLRVSAKCEPEQGLEIKSVNPNVMPSPGSHFIDGAGHADKPDPDKLLCILGRRWALVIIARLCPRPLRFSELLRTIPELSPKMMLERVRELEDYGIMERTRLTEMPGKGKYYALTASGQALRPAVMAFVEFASSQCMPAKVLQSPTIWPSR